MFAALKIIPDIVDEVKTAIKADPYLRTVQEDIEKGKGRATKTQLDLLQAITEPAWKWDCITMDFVTGLPLTPRVVDAVWVIVDRLTKTARFIPIRPQYTLERKDCKKAMGTTLKFSTAFHPQTDEQSERTIQILEDMLRAYVTYEALYGRKCQTPLFWNEVGERSIVGPEFVEETCRVVDIIKERVRTAQNRQKQYADTRRRDLEFAVGDKVFLKVSPMRGLKRFGQKGKLSPRYVGPYEILAKRGKVAYQLALPPSMSNVHDVFHISLLKKYVKDPTTCVDDLTCDDLTSSNTKRNH
ncbi:hypothetical protein NE237_001211 [Protea cynaroides]|uniref:Tf2-1-like SH3-like domain-containing protein n=1 Tax=Protea cynaroides TaxID=273540 RepID=A0A9Q0QXV2_9MAGN|nr:hypothetical protein NE237_001211 [Protea cynaroides]